MGEKLTKSDVAKIEEEINYRKLVVRKNAIEAVKEARAQGDLSENFEYYAAKKDKYQNQGTFFIALIITENIHQLMSCPVNGRPGKFI